MVWVRQKKAWTPQGEINVWEIAKKCRNNYVFCLFVCLFVWLVGWLVAFYFCAKERSKLQSKEFKAKNVVKLRLEWSLLVHELQNFFIILMSYSRHSWTISLKVCTLFEHGHFWRIMKRWFSSKKYFLNLFSSLLNK